MSNLRVGVQTGNFSQANPGGTGTASISNNTIAAEAVGIFLQLDVLEQFVLHGCG